MPYATEENLTDLALKQWEACHSPRLRQIMQSLVKHLHGFARDVDLKQDEWLMAVDWLARTGKLSSEKRQEFILLSDVLGISMLVDAINHRFPEGATPSTVIGPFHIVDSPELPMGANVAEGLAGESCFLVGTVRGMDGKPVTVRTFDLGGEKIARSLSGHNVEPANPALGLRAIRLTCTSRRVSAISAFSIFIAPRKRSKPARSRPNDRSIRLRNRSPD